MTPQEQKKFIESLIKAVQDELLDTEIPSDWEGAELRQWIADKFRRQIVHMSPKRKADYNNTMIVNNL